MELDHILKIIDKVSESGVTSFYYEEGNLKLSVKKKEKQVVAAAPVQMAALPAETVSVPLAAPAAPSQEAALPAGNMVESPLVGTFYSAPNPDSAAFVKVGDSVKKGQVLGIIEAMKLMNEVESEYDGVVKAILVENEQMVEYGQPLFIIG
ncbi:MAG TPA: acetyl-CoA carboxylase biotin carboxyl carrier protein [Candidatus Limivivens intestinipullorum]|uniref:Biotin carboxyl carrier protein of acetyl-CoA carboxylase n=1 Tax=Candidatus Limivivens intestinipullorum TaxID=2840858 RepID=A0A9D1EU43_9FIRM|nr:acetyl-CoA carboxylase biotin carboxyl carrier protein [Candidatus Limivivens intestinipullorum]